MDLLISVETVKQHLHIDDDEDNPAICRLIEAAGQHLASIGVDVTQDPLPAPLLAAMLLLIKTLYDFDTSMEVPVIRLPAQFSLLVAPYREIAL